MNLLDLWNALTGAKTVIEVAKGAVEVGRAVVEAGHAGEEALTGSPEELTARTAVAALYFEILYNVEAISEAQKSDPARLLVSRRVWERSDRILEHLAIVVEPGEVGIVLSPFVQLDNYERVFALPWINLLTTRLTGADHDLLENLAVAFRGAEELLRPKVLTTEQRERLERYLIENKVLEPSVPRRFSSRLVGVVGSLPLEGLAAAAIAAEVLIPDSWLWRRLRAARYNGPGGTLEEDA